MTASSKKGMGAPKGEGDYRELSATTESDGSENVIK